MDDREFELHLSERLHRRFDPLNPSPELRAGVEQVLSTRPQPIGLAILRARRRDIGWAAVLAAGFIVAIAVAGGGLGGPFGPGGPSTPPQSPGRTSTWRDFIVLPPAGYGPENGDQLLANDVLFERIRALLFTGPNQNFSGAGGYALTYQIPPGGPSDETIRRVLGAPGDVRILALAVDGAGGTGGATIGQNPPADARLLIGREDIQHAAIENLQRPVLSIWLRPAAAEQFAAFTASHVGQTFAIQVDDDIAFLPIINEPITDGRFELSLGGPPDGQRQLEAAAIIVGGKLPDSWIVATVPEVLTPNQIEQRLELEFGKMEPAPVSTGISVTDTSLTAILEGRRVVAVWYLTLDGLAAACPSPLPTDERGSCRYTDPSIQHVFDAETGEWLGTAADFDEST